jgi:hypothetical protein
MSSVPATPAAPPADGVPAVPPTVQVFQMFFGVLVTQIVLTMTEYDIPERLAGGARTSSELADATGLHEPSLHRVLRTATGLGLVSQDGDGRFGLGPLGEAARQYDHLSWAFPVLTQLSGVLQTGKTGFELAYGKELFDWLEDHPDEGANFDRVIRLVHGGEDIAIAEAYDFGGVRSVVDVGGGNGTVLATLLARNPHLEGTVFDLPSVIGRGTPALDAHAGRWEAVAGDFFEGVPAGGDVYLLSHIIHDWSEERALTILRNCRSAMGPDGRLLLAEMVVPSGDEMHPAKMLDVLMLVVNGPGMERTEAQYAELLERAGFRLERVVPTASAESIVEARPA